MVNKIIDVLIERDNMSKQEAVEYFRNMRERIFEGEDPTELLREIGLEPDYILDLI